MKEIIISTALLILSAHTFASDMQKEYEIKHYLTAWECSAEGNIPLDKHKYYSEVHKVAKKRIMEKYGVNFMLSDDAAYYNSQLMNEKMSLTNDITMTVEACDSLLEKYGTEK